ncbi:hypothetical protein ELQ90_03575 [Labedella phragmitis]|uniref:Uncharacterized protein n=1 Tax=Labedella phragmitis TaxID=2498849 RepID=A0A3S5CFH9_9MICO|nr:hypothetical protein [Labedella phragmitis]RWZ53020.1 hypothetical protein ELQ90_03575 [Labedella phragmitis]
MNILVDECSVWTTALKADRLLNRLPAEQIAHLGDGFEWDVTESDVAIARRYLIGARVRAIALGREIARMATAPDGVLLEHPTLKALAPA